MLVGLAVLSAGAWLVARPTDAPANAPQTGQLFATSSHVAIVDASTLRLHDRVVRLDGVEAPNRGESCKGTGGATFDCGAAAANALAGLLNGSDVDCTWKGHDRAGRPLAVCQAHGVEVNRALVAAGWARATGTRTAMTMAEAKARSENRGLWGDSGSAGW